MDRSCSGRVTSFEVLSCAALVLGGCSRSVGAVAPRVDAALLGATFAEPAADAGAPDATPAFTCADRLFAAREQLLAAHFDPAKDTADWLNVTGRNDGGVLLNVYTVYSPDGDGYRTFEAELNPSTKKGPRAWRLVARRVLDEFKEERLPERTWRRAKDGWAARIHTRTEDRALVDLFEKAVRPALDDCLDHPGQVGVMTRCEWVKNDFVCRQW